MDEHVVVTPLYGSMKSETVGFGHHAVLLLECSKDGARKPVLSFLLCLRTLSARWREPPCPPGVEVPDVGGGAGIPRLLGSPDAEVFLPDNRPGAGLIAPLQKLVRDLPLARVDVGEYSELWQAILIAAASPDGHFLGVVICLLAAAHTEDAQMSSCQVCLVRARLPVWPWWLVTLRPFPR